MCGLSTQKVVGFFASTFVVFSTCFLVFYFPPFPFLFSVSQSGGKKDRQKIGRGLAGR